MDKVGLSVFLSTLWLKSRNFVLEAFGKIIKMVKYPIKVMKMSNKNSEKEDQWRLKNYTNVVMNISGRFILKETYFVGFIYINSCFEIRKSKFYVFYVKKFTTFCSFKIFICFFFTKTAIFISFDGVKLKKIKNEKWNWAKLINRA